MGLLKQLAPEVGGLVTLPVVDDASHPLERIEEIDGGGARCGKHVDGAKHMGTSVSITRIIIS